MASEMPLLRKESLKRALVCAGELLVSDIAQSLEELGYSVYTWDIEGVALDELSHTVDTFEPEVVFSVNFSDGLSKLAPSLEFHWPSEIDPTSQFLPESNLNNITLVFLTERVACKFFKEAGFPNSQYLATGGQHRPPKARRVDRENKISTAIL